MVSQLTIAQTLTDYAQKYNENLLDRFVLFIPRKAKPLETFYGRRNFQHLCGYSYGNYTSMEFFADALENKLNPDLLIPVYQTKSEAKLRILSTLLGIDKQANSFVRNPQLAGKTRADAICVKNQAAIGYQWSENLLVPCTALEQPPLHKGHENIICVLKTEKHNHIYSIMTKNNKPKINPKKPNTISRAKTRHADIIASLKQYDGVCSIPNEIKANL